MQNDWARALPGDAIQGTAQGYCAWNEVKSAFIKYSFSGCKNIVTCKRVLGIIKVTVVEFLELAVAFYV